MEVTQRAFSLSQVHCECSLSLRYAAMHAVLAPGGALIAGHLAGGTHHAFRDRGEVGSPS